MTDDVLGAIFGISRQTANRYYNAWLEVMRELFSDAFGSWPYIGEFSATIPSKIKSLFPNITLIIDCTEFKIETPRNPDTARKCYSSYKHAYTIKILIGVETDGNVALLSHAFMGGISDIAIVKACGLLDRLEEGSVVLADRGFQLVDVARDHGIRWIVPPSAPTGRGFREKEMTETYKIARARILVERTIGRLRVFRQLEGPLSITSLDRVDKELEVVCHLCKFFPPLVKDSEESFDVSTNFDTMTFLPLSDPTDDVGLYDIELLKERDM